MLAFCLTLMLHSGVGLVHHPVLEVSSPFGARRGPINGRWGFHPGVDFVAVYTPAYNVWKGTVIFAGWQDQAPADFDPDTPYLKRGGVGLGQHVRVLLPSGMVAVYAHLARIDVAVGDVVELGAPLGLTGQTGEVTGPHLHLELRNRHGIAVDPMRYMKQPSRGRS